MMKWRMRQLAAMGMFACAFLSVTSEVIAGLCPNDNCTTQNNMSGTVGANDGANLDVKSPPITEPILQQMNGVVMRAVPVESTPYVIVEAQLDPRLLAEDGEARVFVGDTEVALLSPEVGAEMDDDQFLHAQIIVDLRTVPDGDALVVTLEWDPRAVRKAPPNFVVLELSAVIP